MHHVDNRDKAPPLHAVLISLLLFIPFFAIACTDTTRGHLDGACPACSNDDAGLADAAMHNLVDGSHDANPSLHPDSAITPTNDAAPIADMAVALDLTIARDMTGIADLTVAHDMTVVHDMSVARDMTVVGPITGGPCLSGAAGATAFRVHWTNAGGSAQVNYEAFGFPDRTREKASAYGYQIGFTAQFADPFLGPGGLQLDDSDFIDLEFSTVGIANIASATLSIYGRSYSVGSNGSFNWQTAQGVDSTAVDFVSNVAPYSWYSADILPVLVTGDAGALLRVKAGPSSDSLVVDRLEICLVAN